MLRSRGGWSSSPERRGASRSRSGAGVSAFGRNGPGGLCQRLWGRGTRSAGRQSTTRPISSAMTPVGSPPRRAPASPSLVAVRHRLRGLGRVAQLPGDQAHGVWVWLSPWPASSCGVGWEYAHIIVASPSASPSSPAEMRSGGRAGRGAVVGTVTSRLLLRLLRRLLRRRAAQEESGLHLLGFGRRLGRHGFLVLDERFLSLYRLCRWLRRRLGSASGTRDLLERLMVLS